MYSDFTTNKTEVFKNAKINSFWINPLFMVEIRSEHPGSSTNTTTQDTHFTLVINRLCSDCFVVLLSSVYTEAFWISVLRVFNIFMGLFWEIIPEHSSISILHDCLRG